MLPYTPFTSETLTTGIATVNDISSAVDIGSSLPSGKQVIFFTIGIIAVVASIALISRALIGDSIPPDLLAKLAPLAE